MGANLPVSVASDPLHTVLEKAGFARLHQGKVRDTYAVPGHTDRLLLVASNRLSIFDFVLPGLVPDKGAVLTALTVFWLTEVLADTPHHMLAFGRDLAAQLPAELAQNTDFLSRAMLVKKLNMAPVECVVRGYLTGSGWSAYKREQAVCGHALAEGLHDGSKLPAPIFTPTTKADIGHDEAIDYKLVRSEHGMWLEELTLKVYQTLADYAATRGIILADTKFEFGEGGILGDEVATPDSSRFWDKAEWQAAVAERRSPSGYDKQPVREWGKTVVTPFTADGKAVTGIHKLDTEDKPHLDFVHGLTVPQDVLTETTRRYRRIFELLTGSSLDAFQREKMGLAV
jgi:phosphoribosylaminoimidazole-succinocarboxamide synthase